MCTNHIIEYKLFVLVRDTGLQWLQFANGPGDWGSITSQILPKIQKW